MQLQTITRNTPDMIDTRPVGAAICACGETLYNGKCFNLGDCEQADRGASSRNRPNKQPRAWTMAGRVD